jgi:tetratricopeptide (TPR) repeat protein
VEIEASQTLTQVEGRFGSTMIHRSESSYGFGSNGGDQMKHRIWIKLILVALLVGMAAIASCIKADQDVHVNGSTSEPTLGPAPTAETPTASFIIENKGLLQYDYDDLISENDKKRIEVAVRNTGDSTIYVSGDITINQVKDYDNKPITLVFQMAGQDNEGNYQKQATTEIPADTTVLVSFELLEQAVDPKPGNYTGTLTLTSQGETKVSPEPALSLAIPNSKVSYWDIFIGWFQHTFRKVDLPTFILIIIILGLLIHYVNLIRLRNDPGEVTVEEVENATGEDSIQSKALTARMQDQLEDLGLFPAASQPNGSIPGVIDDLITSSGVDDPRLKLIKPVYDFLWAVLVPRKKHKATSTLYKKNGQYNLTFAVEMDGKTEIIEKVSSDSSADIAEIAARQIYRHIISHPRIWKRIPSSYRFNNAETFEHYQKGIQELDNNQNNKALIELIQAADLESNNVLVRMPIGEIYASSERYLEAMEVYLKIVIQWPEILEARYRLAAVFSFPDKLWGEWKSLDPTRKFALKNLLNQYITDMSIGKPSYPELETRYRMKEYFLTLSLSQLQSLDKELGYWKLTIKYFVTFIPFVRRSDLRQYYAPKARVWPGGADRRSFQKTVQLAELCTKLLILTPNDDPKRLVKEVGHIIGSPFVSWIIHNFNLDWWIGINWKARYTAACFYSLAMASVKNKNFKDELARKGVEQLDLVVKDPKSSDNHDWLFGESDPPNLGDPDLKELREHDKFKEWKSLLKVEPVEPEPGEKEINALARGWELIGAGAAYRAKCWEERRDQVLQLSTLDTRHFFQIQEWYQRELSIWDGLMDLADNPEDESVHRTFWDLMVKDQANVIRMPSLIRQGERDKYRPYKDQWKCLRRESDILQIDWDQAEEKISKALWSQPPPTMTPTSIKGRIDKAYEIWQLLGEWSLNPLNKDFQDAFIKTVSSFHNIPQTAGASRRQGVIDFFHRIFRF